MIINSKSRKNTSEPRVKTIQTTRSKSICENIKNAHKVIIKRPELKSTLRDSTTKLDQFTSTSLKTNWIIHSDINTRNSEKLLDCPIIKKNISFNIEEQYKKYIEKAYNNSISDLIKLKRIEKFRMGQK